MRRLMRDLKRDSLNGKRLKVGIAKNAYPPLLLKARPHFADQYRPHMLPDAEEQRAIVSRDELYCLCSGANVRTFFTQA